MTTGRGWQPTASALVRTLAGAALLTALAVTSGAQTAAPLSPAAQRAVADLQRRLSAIVDDPVLERGTIGITIRSLTRHDTLFARNERKLLMPASATKLITLAAAADRLGWDFTYRTSLLATGTVRDGALDGDLIVVGAGDPTIDDWAGAASDRFKDVAAELKRRGIQSINGRIIGDDDRFVDGELPSGWAWEDLFASYAARVSGLQFNQNAARIAVTPAARAGETPLVEVVPDSAPVVVSNLAVTGRSGGDRLTIDAQPLSPVVELGGSVGPGPRRFVRNISVPNPTLYFVAAFRSALVANGLEVRGSALDIDDVQPRPDRSSAWPITDMFTTTLEAVAMPMMKTSQNLYAETLLRTLGGAADVPATTVIARSVVADALNAWGVPSTDFYLVDGSGLSRYDLITPSAMVTVLSRVWDDERLRQPYLHTLPLAGVDGTLARRMNRTKAAGNARAKTGSFSHARAVAGYVHTDDGEPLAFAILANNYNEDADRIDELSDRLIVTLAEFSRGSR